MASRAHKLQFERVCGVEGQSQAIWAGLRPRLGAAKCGRLQMCAVSSAVCVKEFRRVAVWNLKTFGVVSLRDSRKSALGVSCTSGVGAS
jgi:hypothetical protein